MSAVKLNYDALQTLAITVNGLASGSARQSAAIDWSSAQQLDVAILLQILLVSGAPAGAKKINVYLYGSMDGTNYDGDATGLDAAYTLQSPSNLVLLGSVETPTDKTALAPWAKWIPSVADKFGGYVPIKWGIVVENQTGQAFSGAGHTVKYRGIGAQTL